MRHVAQPKAKELKGEIHHETALCFALNIPRQREAGGVYLASWDISASVRAFALAGHCPIREVKGSFSQFDSATRALKQ
ncbi:protein of unknown function [Methylocella tundrae]|uniref:Uncharacterized protein n=1 Tax=Methylocella tundrae TaxID=227605 RepID=A0A4U8YXY8_METTU|nr:protein of unknown function [Methylocella tundrae]